MKSNKSIFISREIAFLAVLNFFPVQKLIFGQIFFREIDLFDFTSFFGLEFFKFSGPLCYGQEEFYYVCTYILMDTHIEEIL